MTVRQFLKSHTFRCILTLLCIALISGGLLAVLSGVLHVTEEEKTARAIKAIYGKDMDYSAVTVPDGYEKIGGCFLLSDGNYLCKATGGDGYKNGTVTLWVVARFDDGVFSGLGKVAVESYDKQTLMSNFNENYFKVYDGGESHFSTDGENKAVLSGATKSSRAINNAVNAVLDFTHEVLNKEAA